MSDFSHLSCSRNCSRYLTIRFYCFFKLFFAVSQKCTQSHENDVFLKLQLSETCRNLSLRKVNTVSNKNSPPLLARFPTFSKTMIGFSLEKEADFFERSTLSLPVYRISFILGMGVSSKSTLRTNNLDHPT